MEEKNNKEIDLFASISKILKGKKTVALFVLVFSIWGIIVALTNPKSYTSEVVLAPEMNTGGIGLSESLSSMASTFGIDLGGKTAMDAIYPEIYPTVIVSSDFIISLLDVQVYLLNDSTQRSYYHHIANEQKKSLTGSIMGSIMSLIPQKDEHAKNGNIINPTHLTTKQENVINTIKNNIKCIIDGKTRIITIGVTDQDPQVAQIIGDTVQKRLQSYIIKYRTKKANNDLNFYKKLQSKSYMEFKQAQQKYTNYVDAHRNIILSVAETKMEELENDMQSKFNIYNNFTMQVQQATAKVQEHTPAFTIIQKPVVPNRASSTPRSIIVLLYTIFGGIIGAGWVLFSENITRIFKYLCK